MQDIKLLKDQLFPTPVYCFDNILEPEYIDSMFEHVKKSSEINEEKRNNNWQSENNPNLHSHPKYKALANRVLELSKVYLDGLQVEYDELYITGMWSNVLKQKETHSPHTHSNNYISGVFYLQADGDSPAINFMDPRPQASVIQAHAKKYTKENSSMWFYPAVVNRMILFPSWLQHYVPRNISNLDRYSIAFNVMLKGQVGRPENFQSNKFE